MFLRLRDGCIERFRGGKICCSAGLHPETGGGIHVWGLTPASGTVAWHKQLKRSELLVKPGGKIAPNRVMNSPLKSDGVNLSITGVVFAQDESEADITAASILEAWATRTEIGAGRCAVQ